MAESMIDEYPFETNDNSYAKRRYEVMSEDQIAEGEQFLRWYRSAHQDKDNRGLFDRWETINLYWEGEANPPESDTDPGSNTNIVNPNVEGQVAYLVEQNIAVQANPRGPSDLPFAEQAAIVMEFVKEQNRLKRKLDVHERRRQKYGVGIFRVLFDPDCLDGMGLPCIEPCNPAYVFPDPTVTDIYKIQEGRFLIEVINKSLNWARDNFDEDLVDAIQPGYHPLEDEWIFDEELGQNDEISRDSYLHMFIWTRYKQGGERKLRLIQMSGCGVILADSRQKDERDDGEEDKDEEGFYPSSDYPYFFTPDMYRDGTVWAKATAELLINTQDIVDDLDDQIRINARLTGNPQREVDISSGVDPDKLTNEPGLVIPTNQVGSIAYLKPPDMPQYIANRRNQALGIERQIVSRFSDQQSGIKQEGVDTATEALSLQQGANQGINHKKLLLEETLSEVFAYCLELCMEYWTEESFFALTEKPNQFAFFRPSNLKEIPQLMPASDSYKSTFQREFPQAENVPQYMPIMGDKGKAITKKIALDISVTVGAGLPNNKAFVYNVIKEAYHDRAITLQEYRNLLRDYVSLPVEEQPPLDPQQVQEMIQQALQQAMGQIGVQTAQTPNPQVAGLSAQGNPALSVVQGGGM